jgi:hypothetical protein
MVTTETIVSIIGLSIIILVCVLMLCFILINFLQEAKAKSYGRKFVKYIRDKDKEID